MNGLRRLPKRPQTTDADESRPSLPTYVQEPTSKTAEPRRELFFERLPDPWTEDVEASPLSSTRDSALPAGGAEPLPRIRQPLTRSVAPVRTMTAPQPAQAPVIETRASSADISVPERPKGPSGPGTVAARDSDFLGDPKSASARTSTIQRSRPPRPSEQYAAAGTSGEFAVARKSGSFPTAETPGARGTGEMPAVAIGSRAVTKAVRSLPDEAESVAQNAPTPRPARRNAGKSVAGMVLASLALVAYAFQIGPLQSAADAAASPLTARSSALATLMPWLLVVPAILLFGLIIWLLAGIIGLRRTENRSGQPRDAKPSKTPLNQFKSAAQRQGVENRTAYRGWRLLEAACGTDHPITLDSYLAEDLELSPREVRAVHLQLLKDLSRHTDPAMRLPSTETVLDLLRAVDAAPLARPASTSGEVAIPGDPGHRKRKSGASG